LGRAEHRWVLCISRSMCCLFSSARVSTARSSTNALRCHVSWCTLYATSHVVHWRIVLRGKACLCAVSGRLVEHANGTHTADKQQRLSSNLRADRLADQVVVVVCVVPRRRLATPIGRDKPLELHGHTRSKTESIYVCRPTASRQAWKTRPRPHYWCVRLSDGAAQPPAAILRLTGDAADSPVSIPVREHGFHV
jgi:hypothetical protein